MNESWSRRLGWIVVIVVLLDWWSKFLILNQVALYEKVAVVDNWLYLVHLQNQGVAFSILSDSSAAWRTPFLIMTACLAVVLLARFARTTSDRRAPFGIALVMGGALGNLGDRIATGGVTDFLLVSFFPYVFNVADTAIATGAVLLTIGLAGPQASLPKPTA